MKLYAIGQQVLLHLQRNMYVKYLRNCYQRCKHAKVIDILSISINLLVHFEPFLAMNRLIVAALIFIKFSKLASDFLNEAIATYLP